MRQKRFSLIIAAVALAAVALLITSSSTARTSATTLQANATDDGIMEMLRAVNIKLEASRSPFRADRGEYLTQADSAEAGQTVFFNNRTKQLGVHFVPGDPRRGGRRNISYIVD